MICYYLIVNRVLKLLLCVSQRRRYLNEHRSQRIFEFDRDDQQNIKTYGIETQFD